MPVYERFNPLYNAFQNFMEKCLKQDTSLLWPDKALWNLKNLQDFSNRFIDNPDYSDLGFEEKLNKQLQSASNELWGIAADLYYVYSLPSSFISFERKKAYIQQAANLAAYPLPPESSDIWEPLKVGFTRTGQKYHFKFAQFILLLKLAIRLKEISKPTEVLENHKALQETLDNILDQIENRNERSYDMRHAILYLAFPDKYENIISVRDKQKIFDFYRKQVSEPLSEDLDDALLQIRQALAGVHDQDEVPFHYYKDLKEEWRGNTASSIKEKTVNTYSVDSFSDSFDNSVRILSAIKHTNNVILFGPPGTGKTFLADKVSNEIIQEQLVKPRSEGAVIQQIVSNLSMYDLLALSMYQSGKDKTYSVGEIIEHELIQARFQIRPIKSQKESIWGNLQIHTSPESQTVGVNVQRRAEPFLFEKDDQSRWYLTEDGQQYIQTNLAEQLSLLNYGTKKQAEPEDFIKWVTFHQSYSYEDFVEGWRPVAREDNSEEIGYDIVEGVFKEICRKALGDPENKYILVIDEINRGNIAKILGELITLIEDDKRSKLVITLPYSKLPFTVPPNLYLIGTMNTADRSIALLDVALRRRFAFIEIIPQPEILSGCLIETNGASVDLSALLSSLNASIRKHLDRDHQIGHSYFMKVMKEEKDKIGLLEFVWNYQIMPLLNEYFYSRPQKLAEILNPFIQENDSISLSDSAYYVEGEDLVFALSLLSKLGGKHE